MDINPNALNELILQVDNLINSGKANDIAADYANTINIKFDQIKEQINKNHITCKDLIIKSFNDQDANFDQEFGISSIKKEKDKKNKVNQIKNKENKNKSKNKKINEYQNIKDMILNADKTNKDDDTIILPSSEQIDLLESLTKQFQSSLEPITNKIQTVEDIHKIVLSNLSNGFTIDTQGNIIIKGLKKYLSKLHKQPLKLLELSWDKIDQSNKCAVLDDSTILINSTSCYNWFRTEQWFEEDFAVEMLFETTNTNNSSVYFGVMNDTITYSNNCMCCTLTGAQYLTRGGKVTINGAKVNFNSLNFTSLSEAVITLKVYLTKGEIYFKVNDNEEEGPFILPVGEKLKVISGCCGNLNESKVNLIRCYCL